MAKLIYSIQTSLDGYINDDQGKFDWAKPDEEVHTFFNELERPVGTHLYGRRMYEMMRYWQDPDDRRRRQTTSATTPRSGRAPTRSSTRGRSTPLQPRGPESSPSSIPRLFVR